jgi:hypothetical protein
MLVAKLSDHTGGLTVQFSKFEPPT